MRRERGLFGVEKIVGRKGIAESKPRRVKIGGNGRLESF